MRLWDKTALSEGWAIFETEYGESLCRDDEAAKFPTDAEAWEHVWQQAEAGSEPHKAALDYLQRVNPAEYGDIRKFCAA